MKSSLSKWRRLALYKTDAEDKIDFVPSASLVDELAQASQDMQDMRNYYDSLLLAAAAAANSAYEFSESLQDMGSCLMEKTSLRDDEESSRVLLMLGKLQFELQKLVDKYRAHILLTITNPSESLLNELRTVEDMKRQCDEKRNVYEYMVKQQREKGRSKSRKGESFTLQQLQAAHAEYDEEATLCVFRLKSLKQGQYRSLLTQAARHHAAQLNFFRKGLKSLEAVDTHVRLVAERQHIDYQFSGLEDNDGEDGEDSYDINEAGELSFDYKDNKQGLDVVSSSRNSIEVDEVGVSFPQASVVENAEVIWDKTPRDYRAASRERRRSSFSDPIFAEKKTDPAETIRQMQQLSTQTANAYVLPKPIDAKVPISSRNSTSVLHARPTNPSQTYNFSHSTPLEQKKNDKDYDDHHLPQLSVLKAQSVLIESNSDNASTGQSPPLTEGLALPQVDASNTSDTKKVKKQAFSGPLTIKPSSAKSVVSSSGPIASMELPLLVSGVLSHAPSPQIRTSPRVSPTASPPLVSSPRTSAFHELPRPPSGLTAKPAKSHGLVGHSAPLALRNQEQTATNRIPSMTSSNIAAPLPMPPLIVPRSFSIPSSGQRAMAVHVTKLLESPKVAEKAEYVSSPPLTPIFLGNLKPASVVSEVTSQSGQIRGD